MFFFLKRKSSGSEPVDFAQEWLRLRNKYADPAIELARTKQAAIVSAASVLDRIWNGGAGGADDIEVQNDYVAPLREHLVDPSVFSRRECELLAKHLDEILDVTRKNIARIAEVGEEEATLLSASGSVDYIVQRVLVWCRRFPEPIPLGEEEEYRGHF